jgi:hypothetical protein
MVMTKDEIDTLLAEFLFLLFYLLVLELGHWNGKAEKKNPFKNTM